MTGCRILDFTRFLETPAAEVYDTWLTISEGAISGGDSALSYYSDITIKKDYRSLHGHSVDWMELTLNPEQSYDAAS